MIISIKGGGKGKGWSNYVTRKYINLSNYERSRLIGLSGDTLIGDKIIKSSNYKDNSYTLVLGFNGKISVDKAKVVNEEFRKLFMHGFNRDEYHYEAVLHKDTAHDHIHIRIPKKNLLTDTQLRLYLHKNDKERINVIRDYLVLKYDLPRSLQVNKKIINNREKREELISRQRAKNKREVFDFSKKRNRERAKEYINNFIIEAHEAGLIGSLDDIKEVIKSLDLEAVNSGHDYTGDFHYITIEDDRGKKIRLRGEIYNVEFWKYSREDRREQIRTNCSIYGTDKVHEGELQKAEQRLIQILAKRQQEVETRYTSARKRAYLDKQKAINSKNCLDSDDKFIYRSNRGHIFNEISTQRTTLYDTKKSNNNIQSDTRRIDDRIRTDIQRRSAERTKILKKSGTTVIPTRESIFEQFRAERTSLFKQFAEEREYLYSKAQRVVQRKQYRRASSRQNNRAIKQIMEKVDELGWRIRQYQKQSNDFITTTQQIERKIEQIVKAREMVDGLPNIKEERVQINDVSSSLIL